MDVVFSAQNFGLHVAESHSDCLNSHIICAVILEEPCKAWEKEPDAAILLRHLGFLNFGDSNIPIESAEPLSKHTVPNAKGEALQHLTTGTISQISLRAAGMIMERSDWSFLMDGRFHCDKQMLAGANYNLNSAAGKMSPQSTVSVGLRDAAAIAGLVFSFFKS